MVMDCGQQITLISAPLCVLNASFSFGQSTSRTRIKDSWRWLTNIEKSYELESNEKYFTWLENKCLTVLHFVRWGAWRCIFSYPATSDTCSHYHYHGNTIRYLSFPKSYNRQKIIRFSRMFFFSLPTWGIWQVTKFSLSLTNEFVAERTESQAQFES